MMILKKSKKLTGERLLRSKIIQHTKVFKILILICFVGEFSYSQDIDFRFFFDKDSNVYDLNSSDVVLEKITSNTNKSGIFHVPLDLKKYVVDFKNEVNKIIHDETDKYDLVKQECKSTRSFIFKHCLKDTNFNIVFEFDEYSDGLVHYIISNDKANELYDVQIVNDVFLENCYIDDKLVKKTVVKDGDGYSLYYDRNDRIIVSIKFKNGQFPTGEFFDYLNDTTIGIIW